MHNFIFKKVLEQKAQKPLEVPTLHSKARKWKAQALCKLTQSYLLLWEEDLKLWLKYFADWDWVKKYIKKEYVWFAFWDIAVYLLKTTWNMVILS